MATGDVDSTPKLGITARLELALAGLHGRLALLILAVAVPALLLAVSASLSERRQIVRRIEVETLQLAQSIAVEEERWMEGTRQLLVALAHATEVSTGNRDACGRFLASLAEDYESYVDLGVLDPGGAVRCSAIGRRFPVDQADYSCFQRAVDSGGFAVGDWHQCPASGGPAITFGLPKYDAQGDLEAVVYAVLDLQVLNQMDSEEIRQQLPAGSSLTELDHNGTVLVRQPDAGNWLGRTAVDTELGRAVLAGGTGVARMPGLDGAPGVHAYTMVSSRLRSGDIYVIVTAPTPDIFAGANADLTRHLGVIAAVAILTTLGGWVLSDRLVLGPVSALSAAAERLAEGSLDTRSELAHDGSELGRLARSFDRMAATLQTRERENRAATDSLRRQARRLDLLHTIDASILAAHSPEAIVQVALERIRELVPCLRATVLLVDPAGDRLVRIGTSGSGEAPLRVGGQVMLDPYLGFEREPDGGPASGPYPICPERSPVERVLFREGIVSYVTLPLAAGDEPIGSLLLGLAQDQALDDRDLEAARELADSLAVALQNARLLDEVRGSREQTRIFSQQLIEAQETERARVARELHDEIGQALTAIKILLQGTERIDDPSALASHVARSITVVDRALQQVRDLSLDLRPAGLDELGLPAALEWYLERTAETTGLSIRLVAERLPGRWPAGIESACFRVAQEAVTNVVRHAAAARVRVELNRRDGELCLIVRDDGVGFDGRIIGERKARGECLGLLGMEERMALAGGRLEIESAVGLGTEIRACFPLAADALSLGCSKAVEG